MTAALALACSGCDLGGAEKSPGAKGERQVAAEGTARLRRACASQATYDRLKELAFDEAIRIRGGDSTALEAVSTAAVVRMEEPVVKSRDEQLNVTVCEGRFILELPPGAESAFSGQRRLTAEVEYAAQAALDGSGLVYRMTGAEPIIYRLATIGGLRSAQATPPTPPRAAPPAPRQPAPERTAGRPPEPSRAASAPAPEPRAASASARPSFNCRHARSRSERLVCTDGALAARDRRMSSQFYSALAGAEPRTQRALRASRDRFLAHRDRCDNASCVARAYDARMAEIRDISASR
ncbi:MAG TPA: hypothetical protein VEX35_15430 [Allosphingosinicella sp.]|nr:hypothetical protein [Allosphingosinicella sp.]